MILNQNLAKCSWIVTL